MGAALELQGFMNWGWKDIPRGFSSERDPKGRLLIVRENLRQSLALDAVCGNAAEVSPYYGREMLRRVKLRDGDQALIRAYRHGGLFGSVTGNIYFTWPPRPLRELAITEELRRRGVPTVEPCGACVEPVWGPLYRGWFITRELAGARDLWDAANGERTVGFDVTAIFRAAADGVKRMHLEGVYHRDLNLKNILVRRENNAIRSYIIDFDKATLFLGRLPERIAQRNINRLFRSLRKLDPTGRLISPGDWKSFLDRYYDSRSSGN